MKIEHYDLFEETARWANKNTNANKQFLPFLSSLEEAVRIKNILSEMSSVDVFHLATIVGNNQSLLQMIWCLSDYVFAAEVKSLNKDSPEYLSYLEMTKTRIDDSLIGEYELHYTALADKISHGDWQDQ